MKYILFGLLLIPSFALASIDSNLKYGMRSSSVSELQDFLTVGGYMNQTTGFFGLVTLKAVKQYQSDNNIPNTGYVGILTRTSINNALAVDTASSTQAEVVETGTTTPVVVPCQPWVCFPQQTSQVAPVLSPQQTTTLAPIIITKPMFTLSIGERDCKNNNVAIITDNITEGTLLIDGPVIDANGKDIGSVGTLWEAGHRYLYPFTVDIGSWMVGTWNWTATSTDAQGNKQSVSGSYELNVCQ